MPAVPTAQCAVLPVPCSPAVPVIAVDLGADGLVDSVRSSVIEVLLADGLTRLVPHTAPSLGGVVPGWLAVVGEGRLTLTSPSGHGVYDGELPVSEALANAVEDNGWTVLYAGHLALGWGVDAVQAATDAAARGECTAGVVPAKRLVL